jgi:hypothetical protein
MAHCLPHTAGRKKTKHAASADEPGRAGSYDSDDIVLGLWANTLKLCPGYRFQLFYWDYAIGMAVGAVFWGITAGSMPAQRL